MKTALKILLISFAIILIIFTGFFIYFSQITMNENIDPKKLVNMEQTISFYDCNDVFLCKDSGEHLLTDIENIPKHVKQAFVSIEDKRFYQHKGVDYKGLVRAIAVNLKSGLFKEGGSTISQQLIKNTHLNNKKTLKRKLSEIKLAKQLEKMYSKSEILEMYLNTIYFGDNCYGITSASDYYFGKKPEELTLNEGAILAGLIKAPATYSPLRNFNKCISRKNLVLQQMYKQGYISKNDYTIAINENIEFGKDDNLRKNYDYFYLARKEFSEIIKNHPYLTGEVSIYTNYDSTIQEKLETNLLNNSLEVNKSAIMLSNNGEILAYYSTCGDVYRQMGSTIKPLLVYAPAIENNVIYSCSPILDEKTNFNDYSPSNFADKYYGYVSAKDSLAKSLNVCAVKILNYTGVEKSKSYLDKLDITLTSNDNTLGIALGSTEKGATLSEISSAYCSFANNGIFQSPFVIKKIINNKGEVLYRTRQQNKKIFSEETACIINDMLENAVKDGTAKKLYYSNIPLCAKTGTVGNKQGNSDAYNISYNSEKVLGVWYGSKNNQLMDNSVTGGTFPTITASEIWNDVYLGKTKPDSYIKSDNVEEVYIDKIELEENQKIVLADNLAPNRYKLKAIFKKNNMPNCVSTRFTSPKIKNAEISVFSNGNKVSFCLTECCDAIVVRTFRGKKKTIYDTNGNNKDCYFDKDVLPNCEYQYSIIPYYNDGMIKHYGEEYVLNKIKTPIIQFDDWWNN